MKVIIEVKGGTVQNVYTSSIEPVEIEIMDWDNGEEDEQERERCVDLSIETKQMKQVY